ncbi:MAG: hypothetical protein WCR98_05055 [Saccharofermentanales bacterium]
MNKPTILYTAFTKAVDDFNTRHHLCRGHLAAELGYSGENAAIQFSNALSPKNNDKTINDEKKYLLLHALDDQARMVFFREWMLQFGLQPSVLQVSAVCTSDFHTVIDDAEIEISEAFRVTKMALKDQTLDEEELEAIIKENLDAAHKRHEIVAMATARLKKMREE